MNTKQTVFVEEYLKCWNSSEAARRAGYNGRSNQIGSRLLTNVDIKAEIDARIAELKMSTDEVLVRLAEQARGDLGEFTEINLLADLKEHPKSHLVKRLTTDVVQTKDGKITYKTHFELYDAQAALVHISKIHGIVIDKLKVDLDPAINEALRIAWGIAPKGSDADNSDD